MEVKPGYKQTEVGAIPEDWAAIDLITLCTLQRGYDITETTRVPGPVPVFSSSGISYFHNKAMVNPPGVVTGRKGILGNVFLINEPFWPHDTTLWVKDFRGNLPAYVALVLQNFHLERLDAATSVPTLNRNNLAGHLVPFPPSRLEQEAIAEALSDTDALIESLEQLLAKKRQLKQGAMQALLTGKKRLPGFERKPGYKQTDVGVIPEDWRLLPLLSAVRIANGQVDPKVEPYRSMTLVAPDHIESGSGRLMKKETARDQRAISGKYLFAKGDIVYSKIRPYLKKAILADFDGLCSADMYPLKPASNVSAGFILAALLGHHFSNYAESVSVRSGMPKINRSELAEYTIALPPTKNEQQAIAAMLSDMDAAIAALETKVAKARNIKQGMMQELLTGRIRLPVNGREPKEIAVVRSS